MKMLKAIFNGVWMMESTTLSNYLPLAAQILSSGWSAEREDIKPYAQSITRMGKYTDLGNAPSGSIAVYPITGVITKFDQFSGNYGTESLMEFMRKADKNDNIAGHFLEMDCGGGEASNIETVARMIREEIKKPVVAWYNNMACSAAYYLGAAADEIYASEETDIVGSIGTMFTFRDFTGYFEKMGIKLHEVYASQSELKNKDLRDAREGEYDAIQEKILDPYAQRFIDTIKEFRPLLKKDEAFKGDIFGTPSAIAIGMIDGMKSKEAAMERVIELSNLKTSNVKNIEAVLGYEIESSEGGSFLRDDELAKLDRKLVTDNREVVDAGALATLTQNITALAQSVTAMTDQVSAMADKQAALQSEFEAFKSQAGAAKTAAAATEPPLQEGTLKDALDALNTEMQKAAAAGTATFVK